MRAGCRPSYSRHMETYARTLFRPIAVAAVFALVAATGLVTGPPPAVDAASCVRVVGGDWNPAGNENYRPSLNYESTKIKNFCSTAKLLTGWKLHDYGRKHTYTFRTGFKVGAGVTVSIFSGTGTRTATKLYWGRTYGAVWNNAAPEKAYLRNASGTLMSSWAPATAVAQPTIAPPTPSCDPNYSGYCVPVVSYDLDCPDIGHRVYVVGVDIHGFDADGDGDGCESYPSA